MKCIGLFCFLLFLLECRSEYGSFEIVGGDAIEIEKVPFFAMYRMKKTVHGCGAFIVTDQFIVSAAHCHLGYGHKDAEVVVGTDEIKAGESYDIMEAYPHPKFNIIHIDGDVVVLKLMKKLVFGERVQPIKLAEPGLVIEDGAVFQTMGFGRTDPNNPGISSDILLSVEVPFVNDAKCVETYKDIEITKRMICAGEEGKSVCNGDSGGPLVYKDTAIGIVSFGYGCAQKGWPAVYARVSALRDFIDSVMKEHA